MMMIYAFQVKTLIGSDDPVTQIKQFWQLSRVYELLLLLYAIVWVAVELIAQAMHASRIVYTARLIE